MAPKTEKAVLREATVTRKGRTNFANLRDQLWHGKMLPTPSASDPEGGVMEIRPGTTGKYKLRDQVPHFTGGKSTGLRLQPGFALWMMGYPTDWLDLADGEMPLSKARAMRLSPK